MDLIIYADMYVVVEILKFLGFKIELLNMEGLALVISYVNIL
jgi:hypothetical protein